VTRSARIVPPKGVGNENPVALLNWWISTLLESLFHVRWQWMHKRACPSGQRWQGFFIRQRLASAIVRP